VLRSPEQDTNYTQFTNKPFLQALSPGVNLAERLHGKRGIIFLGPFNLSRPLRLQAVGQKRPQSRGATSRINLYSK
jgi:hypothetical protein